MTGKTIKYDDIRGDKGTCVIFMCNHCPFVIHLKDSIKAVTEEYSGKGIGFVGISSNSTKTHPQDGPDNMAKEAKEMGYVFPYLFDETQVGHLCLQMSPHCHLLPPDATPMPPTIPSAGLGNTMLTCGHSPRAGRGQGVQGRVHAGVLRL